MSCRFSGDSRIRLSRKSRKNFAAAVPPVASAWLVCASLFPALWLGEELWAREHADEHSLRLLNAFTVTADPMLGYAALIFTLLALLVAVLEHEAAHHTRRDNLLKWALTICRYATPAFPLTAVLYRRDDSFCRIRAICSLSCCAVLHFAARNSSGGGIGAKKPSQLIVAALNLRYGNESGVFITVKNYCL